MWDWGPHPHFRSWCLPRAWWQSARLHVLCQDFAQCFQLPFGGTRLTTSPAGPAINFRTFPWAKSPSHWLTLHKRLHLSNRNGLQVKWHSALPLGYSVLEGTSVPPQGSFFVLFRCQIWKLGTSMDSKRGTIEFQAEISFRCIVKSAFPSLIVTSIWAFFLWGH